MVITSTWQRFQTTKAYKKRPTYYTKPTGEVPVFTRSYRTMEGLLREAAEAMNTARPLVPERCRVGFEAEDSSIQWFYRTARSEANFYESCMLRDRLLVLAAKATRSPEEIAEGAAALTRWTAVLEDERENTRAAVPIIAADVRLDAYYGGDHTFLPYRRHAPGKAGDSGGGVDPVSAGPRGAVEVVLLCLGGSEIAR